MIGVLSAIDPGVAGNASPTAAGECRRRDWVACVATENALAKIRSACRGSF